MTEPENSSIRRSKVGEQSTKLQTLVMNEGPAGCRSRTFTIRSPVSRPRAMTRAALAAARLMFTRGKPPLGQYSFCRSITTTARLDMVGTLLGLRFLLSNWYEPTSFTIGAIDIRRGDVDIWTRSGSASSSIPARSSPPPCG